MTFWSTCHTPARKVSHWGKGWKLHGAGKDKTTVQLSAYLPVLAAMILTMCLRAAGLGWFSVPTQMTPWA